MKKIYTIFSLFFVSSLFAQYNQLAPWMQNNTSEKKELTFQEMVDQFDHYWKDKDFTKKGSGHKPFKRWENYWQNLVNDNGNLISPQEFYKAFQEKNSSKGNRSTLALPTSNWTPVGPFTHTNTGSWSNGQGRVNYIEVDPSNPNIIYIGAPAGGIWKSTNAGSTWTPLSDNLPQIGVSGIAVDHTNSNVIYIATGDKDSSDTYSIGVLKSTDGGLTWNTTGLSFANTSTLAGDLIMHPSNNQILWCATSIGLYKTSNGGTTWTNVQAGNFAQGTIRLKPNDPNVVYAVSNSRFFKSTNAGDTFTVNATNSGLPFSSGRLNLDVTANDPNYIYILSATTGSAFQGIYRSTTAGEGIGNWVKISNTSTPAIFDNSTQAWYDMAFAASPNDKNEIYTGVLNIWKSSNGGEGFTKLNNWNAPTTPSYTHADIHFLRYYGNKLYAGTDGGIYVSSDNGVTFTNLTEGLQISQFYKVSVSKQSSSKMVGGLQDNGGHAYSGGVWKNYYGADGMDTAIDPNNSNKYYGFIQYGGTLYISNNAGDSLGSGISAPAAETGTDDSGGNWVTPLATNNAGELFSGYSKLYKLSGSAWVEQSTAAIGSGNIELISVDPSNDDIMFVANGSGLYKSTDRGLTFTNVYNAASNITSICVNYSNSNIVYLTTSGTSGQALKSTNGGLNFTNFSTNLPAIGKNVIKHQGRNTLNPLYLGTSLGVYYTDDSMSQWEPFDANLPNVSVTDLEINLEDNILTAATYGRGIWQSPIPVEVPSNDVKLVELTSPSSEIICSGNVSPVVVVKNNGTNTISSVNLSYDYSTGPQNYTWTGNINTNETQSITIPNFNVSSRGAYELNVNTTISNDAYSDNNNGKVSFYVNSQGTVGTMNTFESTSDNLLTFNDGAVVSQWKRGINNNAQLAIPGNNVYTTNFTGNYPDMTKAYLVSQCYNLTNVTNPQIKFKMKFDLEQNWDIVYVEYSTNMGQSWSVLGTQATNWYNSNRTQATAGNDCYNCPGAQWTGTNTTLTEYSYPLNALIGQPNVIFRIVFHSDEAENKLGVVVDDFVIEGTLSNEVFELKNIAIYPNPSTGIFTIATGDKPLEELEVYDMTGKIIMSNKNMNSNNSETLLDLRNTSTGIYFIKITSGNQTTTKRIIKN